MAPMSIKMNQVLACWSVLPLHICGHPQHKTSLDRWKYSDVRKSHSHQGRKHTMSLQLWLCRPKGSGGRHISLQSAKKHFRMLQSINMRCSSSPSPECSTEEKEKTRSNKGRVPAWKMIKIDSPERWTRFSFYRFQKASYFTWYCRRNSCGLKIWNIT